MGGEELCLLGVRAVARRDQQRQPGLAVRGRRHAIEGDGHVGTHRLALAIGERAVVAAPAGLRRHPETVRAGHDLGRRAGLDLDRVPPLAGKPHVGLLDHGDRHARGREVRPLEGHAHAGRRHAVATGAAHRAGASARQIRGVRQVPRVRNPVGEKGGLEQPRKSRRITCAAEIAARSAAR
jgi:hypothetical protein